MQCTARSKQSGKRCQRAASPGKTVCVIHGGRTPTKHGMYSKFAKGQLAELIEANRTDPGLTDIREHLAVLAALSQDLLSRKDSGRLGSRDREALARLADRGIDGVRKLTEVEKGLTLTIRPETFDALVGKVVDVAGHVFREHPDLLTEFARRLAALGPGPSSPAADSGEPDRGGSNAGAADGSRSP